MTRLSADERGGLGSSNRPGVRTMVRVTVYARHHSGLIRIGAITILPAPDASGRQVVLDPRNCVPDRVGLRIKEGLLAGAALQRNWPLLKSHGPTQSWRILCVP